MTVDQVKSFCRGLVGSVETLKGPPSNILSYAVSDKKFAYFKTSEPEQWRFSFRVTPERFVELTDQPGIKPARYMHPFHWVTVVNVKTIPDEYLQQLITASYTKALQSLSKVKQLQIEQQRETVS